MKGKSAHQIPGRCERRVWDFIGVSLSLERERWAFLDTDDTAADWILSCPGGIEALKMMTSPTAIFAGFTGRVTIRSPVFSWGDMLFCLRS